MHFGKQKIINEREAEKDTHTRSSNTQLDERREMQKGREREFFYYGNEITFRYIVYAVGKLVQTMLVGVERMNTHTDQKKRERSQKCFESL